MRFVGREERMSQDAVGKIHVCLDPKDSLV
jgi:hypothetical protein